MQGAKCEFLTTIMTKHTKKIRGDYSLKMQHPVQAVLKPPMLMRPEASRGEPRFGTRDESSK